MARIWSAIPPRKGLRCLCFTRNTPSPAFGGIRTRCTCSWASPTNNVYVESEVDVARCTHEAKTLVLAPHGVYSPSALQHVFCCFCCYCCSFFGKQVHELDAAVMVVDVSGFSGMCEKFAQGLIPDGGWRQRMKVFFIFRNQSIAETGPSCECA